jgi:flagellar hook-basal body complex protein FliE
MTAIPPLGAVTSALGAVAGVAPTTAAGTTAGVAPASGSGFATTLVSSLENVQKLQANSADLAIQAATGDLNDVADYTVAASKAQMATEVTVAVRNKALDSFNEIMRMQV